MNYLFWCEFPERIDWNHLNTLLKKHDFVARVGIACTSRADYLEKKKLLDGLSHLEFARGWPTLPKEKGYWFSSQSAKEDIDVLHEYRGLSIKLDIEPPIPEYNQSYAKNFLKLVGWLTISLLSKGKNKAYLGETIRSLQADTDVMLSTFALPRWIGKRIGMTYDSSLNYNYIYYSSFAPFGTKWAYDAYMSWFVKREMKENKNTHIAVGLLTPGIFNDEPCYASPKELEKDIIFLKKRGVENVVVFRLGSLLELEAEPWIRILTNYANGSVPNRPLLYTDLLHG